MTTTPPETTADDYVIRQFEAGDEADFVALYNETWTTEKTTDWFDWRYRDNPYVDEVTMFVAEYDGHVVATRPFKAFRVRGGEERRLAFLCTDTMTDADHRRRGLFRTMTEASLEHYADRPTDERPAFLFNHSNQYSRPGYEKMGWEYTSPQVRYNRLQRAGSYVADAVDGVPGTVGGAVATALNRGVLRVTDSRVGFDTEQFAVERHDAVPVETLAAVYESCRPDAVHVVCDAAFFEWRSAEPGNRPDAAYVVRRDGHPVAGLVVYTTHDGRNDTTMAEISHVVPAAGGPDRTDAVAAAVEAVLADYRAADLVRTANPLVPPRVLRAYGFLPDDRLPMSKLTEPLGLTLGTRPLVDGEWHLNGRSIRGAEPFLWTLA